MNESFSVYMHVAPNGKKYIGITCQACRLRWRNGKGYEKNPHFWRAIQKYSWENFDHIVLYSGLDKKTAEQKEIQLISEYKANDKRYGFNIENGGNVKGKATEEIRKKMSAASTGKRHSEETRQKISIGGKGIKKSEEARKRMSLSQVGEKNHQYGKLAHNAKKVAQLQNGEVLNVFLSSREAQKETGILARSIRAVCAGEHHTTGGYGWRYE